jgi:hypothetical protein
MRGALTEDFGPDVWGFGGDDLPTCDQKDCLYWTIGYCTRGARSSGLGSTGDGVTKRPSLTAVRAAVKACGDPECEFWPYRMGRFVKKAGRSADEQAEAASAGTAG